MTLGIQKCGLCGGKLAQPARGRRRFYCSDRCRRAAWRARQSRIWLDPRMTPPLLPEEIDEALRADLGPDLGQPGDPDEAMVRCLMDAYALIANCERCATYGRRELRWHFHAVATGLAELLRLHFKYEGEKTHEPPAMP